MAIKLQFVRAEIQLVKA